MKTIGLKNILSKKVIPTVLVIGMAVGASSCAKGISNKDEHISTTVSDTKKETENACVKVYKYAYKAVVANVVPGAIVGSEIQLAENDELAVSSIDAMNGKFTAKIGECKYANPGENVNVLAIASMDKDGSNYEVSYEEGINSLNSNAYYLSYLVGNENGQLGWVSYEDDSLILVEESVKESLESETPAGLNLIDTREVNDVNYQPDDNLVVTRQYLLK